MRRGKPGVLILSNPSDPHAFAVEAGLQAKGTDVQIWHTPDWPTLQVGTFELGTPGVDLQLKGPELEVGQGTVGTLWVRRPLPPNLPGNLDPADHEIALRENTLFVRSLTDLIIRPAFVVNPLSSQRLTILRSAQLLSALKAGFQIPRTLCSNDPERIRNFVAQAPRGVIFKSFFPMAWESNEGRAILFTSKVRIEDLSDDDSLKACPGIFQELIPKAFELRVTAMGERLFAAKLLSQGIDRAQLDYRVALDEVPMEPAELPQAVANACLAILRDLGIVFGCFDLIVTPAGEYVFLEVNEMGAFLWVEERLPELRLLDAFCEFLAQGRSDFLWKEGEGTLRAADFTATVEAQLSRAPAVHVPHQRSLARDP